MTEGAITAPSSAPRRTVRLRLIVASSCCAIAASTARAQSVSQYFPSTLPGYQNDLTIYPYNYDPRVLSGQGIEIGDFNISPSASEGIGWSSNPLGDVGHGSATFNTGASLSARSNWEENAVGANLSVNNSILPNEPIANQTNWAASLGGSLDLGDTTASAGYSHIVRNLSPTDLGALGVTAPVPYSDDDIRIDESVPLGQLKIIPAFDYQNLSFGSVTSPEPIDYSGLDHQVESGTLTGLAEISGGESVVAVIRGTEAQYVQQADKPDYDDVLGLTGVDFDTGLIRVRLLVGAESRSFLYLQSESGVTPSAELDLIWQLTRLTRVTASFTRGYEDPSFPFIGNEVNTQGQVAIRHELRRNVTIGARFSAGVNDVDIDGVSTSDATQTVYNVGLNAGWALNRHVELDLSAGYTSVDYSEDEAALARSSGVPLSSFDAGSVGLTFRITD